MVILMIVSVEGSEHEFGHGGHTVSVIKMRFERDDLSVCIPCSADHATKAFSSGADSGYKAGAGYGTEAPVSSYVAIAIFTVSHTPSIRIEIEGSDAISNAWYGECRCCNRALTVSV